MSDVIKELKKVQKFMDAHGGGLTVEEAREKLDYVRVRVDQLMRSGKLRTTHLFRTPVISKNDVEERIRLKKERAGRRRTPKLRP